MKKEKLNKLIGFVITNANVVKHDTVDAFLFKHKNFRELLRNHQIRFFENEIIVLEYLSATDDLPSSHPGKLRARGSGKSFEEALQVLVQNIKLNFTCISKRKEGLRNVLIESGSMLGRKVYQSVADLDAIIEHAGGLEKIELYDRQGEPLTKSNLIDHIEAKSAGCIMSGVRYLGGQFGGLSDVELRFCDYEQTKNINPAFVNRDQMIYITNNE